MKLVFVIAALVCLMSTVSAWDMIQQRVWYDARESKVDVDAIKPLSAVKEIRIDGNNFLVRGTLQADGHTISLEADDLKPGWNNLNMFVVQKNAQMDQSPDQSAGTAKSGTPEPKAEAEAETEG